MKDTTLMIMDRLLMTYPGLTGCKEAMACSAQALIDCYNAGGKALICGNGGSAADAEHIVGELMKGFRLKRPLSEDIMIRFKQAYPDDANTFLQVLQQPLAAISLVSQVALTTAISNDVSPGMIFAQQVLGYGGKGDILMGISTSGNTASVVNAAKTAKIKSMTVIGLTGSSGGELAKHCDIAIRVPAADTYSVQEYHLPVYHALCAMIENEIFSV